MDHGKHCKIQTAFDRCRSTGRRRTPWLRSFTLKGIHFALGNPTHDRTPSDLQTGAEPKKKRPPLRWQDVFCYRRGGRSLLTRELFKTHGFASDSLYHNTPKAKALFSLFGRLERLRPLTKYTSIPKLYQTT